MSGGVVFLVDQLLAAEAALEGTLGSSLRALALFEHLGIKFDAPIVG